MVAPIAGDRLGIRTTQFVEIDPDARLILGSQFPTIPIHGDIRDYHPQRGEFDIIWNSFPCTRTSNAGQRQGLSHPESSLWREGIRILIECRPRFFIIEQPTGVVDRGLRAILGALRMVGYAWEIEIISAAECGGGHRRERLFIISYPDREQGRYQQTRWADQVRELKRAEYTTTTQTTGRIRSRYLAGRTVTPAQASIALQRILYLHDLG